MTADAAEKSSLFKELQMNDWFSLFPQFLRNPQTFWDDVRAEKSVGRTVVRLVVLTTGCLAAYGFTLGLSHGWQQAISSAVKMPLLILATIFFCLPALHFFSLAVLGTPLKLLSTAAVLLAGVGVTAFLLLGLAPVTLFFVLTSEDYPFFQLPAVAFVAVSGVIGLQYMWRGMTAVHRGMEDDRAGVARRLLAVWMGLYAFVATQMTWRLSPLVGDPSMEFVLLRPSRGNFYVDVVRALDRALGFSGTRWIAGASMEAFCSYLVFASILGFVVWCLGKRYGEHHARRASYHPPAVEEKN